jgi:hypothetical protein
MSILLQSDKTSATWQRIQEHLQARVNSLRSQNDNVALGAEETAHLRGRITELKYFLKLDQEDPHIPD